MDGPLYGPFTPPTIEAPGASAEPDATGQTSSESHATEETTPPTAGQTSCPNVFDKSHTQKFQWQRGGKARQ